MVHGWKLPDAKVYHIETRKLLNCNNKLLYIGAQNLSTLTPLAFHVINNLILTHTRKALCSLVDEIDCRVQYIPSQRGRLQILDEMYFIVLNNLFSYCFTLGVKF